MDTIFNNPNRAALEQELQANEAKIASLKAELSRAQADDDAFMDRLAENRAKRGDTGYHLNLMQWNANRRNSERALEAEKAQNAWSSSVPAS